MFRVLLFVVCDIPVTPISGPSVFRCSANQLVSFLVFFSLDWIGSRRCIYSIMLCRADVVIVISFLSFFLRGPRVVHLAKYPPSPQIRLEPRLG